MLIVFFLFGSCSTGGSEPEESVSLEEEVAEEKPEGPDEKEDISEDVPEDIFEEIPPPPIFLYCKMVSEKEIVFGFSRPVKMTSLSFNPALEYEAIEEGCTVKVNLTENPEPGLLVEAELSVKDKYGNIINEQIKFRTGNNRIPDLQINELRTEYVKPKAEFIEFKMLSGGNLGGLRVFVAGNYTDPLLYEFKPVEVKEGEYVVLHLRTLEESCKDEYGESLNESGGTDSCSTARDFWIPGSHELLHKTDAVYVLDQDDCVLDAVMLAESPALLWGKTYFSEAAKFLFNKGAWKSAAGTVCGPMDAVNSSDIGGAVTRSISRDETAENTPTAADWYVTATSGATPGLPNNPKRL
jgi:hypothetical protein